MKLGNMTPSKCCIKQDLEIIEMINWDNWIYECKNCKKRFVRRHHFFHDIDKNTIIPTIILRDNKGIEFKIVLGIGKKNGVK